MKSKIGQCKDTTYDLPTASHTYGLSNKYDRFNARSLINDWDVYKADDHKKTLEQDFSRINKKAVSEGVTNCREIREYRKSIDIKRIPRYESRLSAKQTFWD